MSQPSNKPKLHPALAAPAHTALTVAHRGASKHAQENTLEAFERAIELRSHIIEFDVRAMGDGVLVIHHDSKIQRGRLRELSYAQAIKHYPAENLVTLQQALDHIGHRAILNIEIKEEGLAPEVLRVVRANYKPNEYVISSFYVSVLAEVRRLAPETCTGLVLGSPVRSQSLLSHAKDLAPWDRFVAAAADFLAVHYFLADLAVLRGARRRGIPVMVWTVNSPRRRKRLAKSRGVVAVIVDDPTRP